MTFYSIRTKILFLGLIFSALIGSAFFIYSMRTTVNYRLLRLESIVKTVAYETEKVNKIIAEIEHGALFYAISGMLCFNAQSEELGIDLVIEYISNFPLLVGGGFWFEPYAFEKDRLRAGFYAFRDKETGIVNIDDSFFMDEYDYHNSGWYREILENVEHTNRVFWTRPYVDDSGSFNLMTTASVGIFDNNGRLIAMTTADWEIEEVVKELAAVKPTENSFVLLCVPEKDYVISSTRTNTAVGASMADIPWDITADAFYFNGTNYLRFGKYMDNGWLLSIQIPEQEIFAEVERRNEHFSIAIGVVSLIMLLVAWFLISRLINAPIKQLTFEVSQIALGNLDAQIKINSKDELGLLANVFNKVTSDLKNSIVEKAKERADKDRISAELSVAASIQSSMLPCVFPQYKEFELYASMTPAKEVCGDFYDFFFIDKDNLVVLIADVSGKGVPAALFMVIAKTLIKNCSSCKSAASVFESVNIKLCDGNETGMFVTSFIAFYNISTGRLTYVNAGHNPPLLKKGNGSFEFLRTKPCIVLGFMENSEYREEEVFLDKGDTLYLYTDGITEAMNKKRELFGENRLLDAANKNINISSREFLDAIKLEVDMFAQGAEQADDITMLALRILGFKDQQNNCELTKSIIIEAKSDNFNKLLKFINDELECNECAFGIKNEILIAVEEIFMNITNYAYEDKSGDVCITFTPGSKTIIKFEDTGKPYNPLEQPEPDFDKSITDRQIGGLGIYMVKNLMNTVEYSRIDDKNVLIMTKSHPKR